MAKPKSYFFCQECGYQSSSWLGRCPECGKFGTFAEEVIGTDRVKSKGERHGNTSTPQRIQDITYSESKRITTHCGEWM